MQLTGLAMPFGRPSADDAHVTIGADGGLTAVRSSRSVQFARGAFMHAIANGYAEIVVNHAWREHLASTVHGLELFETFAGLYFHATLPDTPYARSVYKAITSNKIMHVCCLSSSTECDDDGETLTVRRAHLVALNLLLVASAHRPDTWILEAGPAAEARIHRENIAAEGRALWALNPSLTVDDIVRELAKHGDDAEARAVLAQLNVAQLDARISVDIH